MGYLKLSKTVSLLRTVSLTMFAILMAVPAASAQGTKPPPLDFALPSGFRESRGDL